MSAAKKARPASQHDDSLANAAFSWGAPTSANAWLLGDVASMSRMMAQSALASVEAMESVLSAWRNAIDTSRSSLRAQQDAMLDAVKAQLRAGPGARKPGATGGDAAGLLSPMLAAVKVGEAVLEAQRGALDALSKPKRLH